MSCRIEPFKVHLTDEQLQELKDGLRAGHVAYATYEQLTTDRYFGIRREQLRNLKSYWETSFDWRKQEARLNAVPHFIAHLPQSNESAFRMHFMHEPSSDPDAVPILLLHGWPVCFLVPLFRS